MLFPPLLFMYPGPPGPYILGNIGKIIITLPLAYTFHGNINTSDWAVFENKCICAICTEQQGFVQDCSYVRRTVDTVASIASCVHTCTTDNTTDLINISYGYNARSSIDYQV